MNGKFERDEKADQQCQHCGLFFDQRGIKAHELHCRFRGRDVRILPLEKSGGDPPESALGPEPPESPDGTGGGVSDSGGDPNAGVEKPTRADGGPGLGLEGPPADESATSSAGTETSRPTVDELPDRYVEVEAYVAEVRERAPAVDAEALRSQLAQFDVVDVEETTEESIAAYTLDEVDP